MAMDRGRRFGDVVRTLFNIRYSTFLIGRNSRYVFEGNRQCKLLSGEQARRSDSFKFNSCELYAEIDIEFVS